MNHSLLSAALAAALCATACGPSQARLYNIAVDGRTLSAIPTSCFEPGTMPSSTRFTTDGFRIASTWSVWDGVDGVSYLDLNAFAVNVGDVGVFELQNGVLVEGKDKQFAGTITNEVLTNPAAPDPTFSSKETRSFTFAFDELGATAKGNIALAYAYQCTGTTPFCDTSMRVTDCSITVPFTGRRIDYSNEAEASP